MNMASLRSKLVVPFLLAGSALVSAANANDNKGELSAIKSTTAAACPTQNVTRDNQFKCVDTAKKHVLTLAKLAPLDDKFKKACTFTELAGNLEQMAAAMPKDTLTQLRALNTSRQVANCVGAVGRSTRDDDVRATVYAVRDTMVATLKARP